MTSPLSYPAWKRTLVWLLLAWPVQLIQAAPLTLLLDTNLSSIKVSIDAFGQRDTQQSKIGGEIHADLAAAPTPSQISIGEFTVRALQVMNFKISFGLVGSATAKVNDLQLTRVELPVPATFVPVAASGAFTVENLRYQTFGDGSYTLIGLPCSLAQASGRDCQDSVDFDSGPPGTISQMTGKVVVQGSEVRLDLEYFFSQPLDPQNPELATVSGPVTIVAKGQLPPVEVRLEIERDVTGKGIALRWPASAVGLNLVAAGTLPPLTRWQPVDATPVLKGEFLEVRLPGTANDRYFRLQ